MTNETFNTHITFTSGDPLVEKTTSENLLSTIQRLLTGPAAMMGMIKEVKIVDTWDCIVFLARDGKVIFPNKNEAA